MAAGGKVSAFLQGALRLLSGARDFDPQVAEMVANLQVLRNEVDGQTSKVLLDLISRKVF